ncbi:MarR family winged helix-turn-helix transcriptional regulator [Undibacterium sp. MH2W]|uniref:MarR family winged helix-turn-helix transcriptional regulator n=1 Tax=Undibacterium sp. MH2W TaxID=3413044 RepID=UPI003BF41834
MKKQVDKVNQSPTADMVFEAIHTVMHLYRSQRSVAFRAGEQDITHMESRVLHFFSHHPGSTLSDLVLHSGRDKAQLTRLIRGLREHGYLEAREDATDRRHIRLQLSQTGKAVHEELQKQGAEVIEKAVEGLSEDQCDTLVELLHIVQSNLERQQPE